MTYEEPATKQQVSTVPPDDGHAATSEQPAYQTFSPSHDGVSDPAANFDTYVDDDEEWVSEAPKGVRVRVATGVLLLALFAVAGLWGGSVVQKRHDKSTAATRTATGGAAFAGRRSGAAAGAGGGAAAAGGGAGAGAAGGTGAAGGAAARAGATAGIVTDIQGATIYLTDASGNLVKITTSAASTVRKTDAGTMSDIKPGQTLIVTGAKAADGSTAARTITISTAALGSGGGGGFGGGTGAGG
jgi:hypothetical protein